MHIRIMVFQLFWTTGNGDAPPIEQEERKFPECERYPWMQPKFNDSWPLGIVECLPGTDFLTSSLCQHNKRDLCIFSVRYFRYLCCEPVPETNEPQCPQLGIYRREGRLFPKPWGSACNDRDENEPCDDQYPLLARCVSSTGSYKGKICCQYENESEI